MKTSLSFAMPCWEAALALPTHRNLCAWLIIQEIKKIQSIWLSNIYVGWWFKLQSLKNLALSKVEPCQVCWFFSPSISLESLEKKIHIFPYNNICTFEGVQNTFRMKGFPFEQGRNTSSVLQWREILAEIELSGPIVEWLAEAPQWDWRCSNYQAHGPSDPAPPQDVLAVDLRIAGIISAPKTRRQVVTWTAGKVKHFTALIKCTFLWRLDCLEDSSLMYYGIHC